MIKEMISFNLCFSIWIVGMFSLGFIIGLTHKQTAPGLMICVFTGMLLIYMIPGTYVLCKKICKYIDENDNLAMSDREYLKTNTNLYKSFNADKWLTRKDYGYIILFILFIIFAILLRSVKYP